MREKILREEKKRMKNKDWTEEREGVYRRNMKHKEEEEVMGRKKKWRKFWIRERRIYKKKNEKIDEMGCALTPIGSAYASY
jgi:hypothetical protein